MKKQILALALGLISVATFAQKNELKAAEKAIKKQDFKTAITVLKPLDAMEASMGAKYKAKFYFLKGQAYSKSDLKIAAESFNNLFSYEKEIGKSRYSKDAQPMLFNLKEDIRKNAFALYEQKDYKNASKTFYLRYQLDKKDTLFLANAALIAFQGKDYETSLPYYKELEKLGYTGISIEYRATNKKGEEVNLGTKTQRDLFVKTGEYSNPKDVVNKSKRGLIMKNIALILKEQGKVDEAIVAMENARKSNPNDIDLILTHAFIYNDLKQMDKFGELIEEAIKLDPNNPTLFFNLGVASAEQKLEEKAIGYYKKAIELDPNYRDAYLNLAYTITNARIAVVEEMNNNLDNAKKYEELENKNKDICKRALPFLEKADSLKRTLDTVRNLMNLYDTLEMFDKSDELRPIYKKLREEQGE
ncbi:tetratricopeptide repeat protein [Polaribacter sp. MSW13]|uniref:Tetratricopeptide repeat protein n=1 Tax=Polaribacter marinus TaxID=2916838 RepID=A0A9X2AN66_9FLAO|nr:tetratricopeptide repeat protein [Polaribacter marinus]MCI2229604.1 tetratricopeptide repeat protein [Polaribacter marinus]